MVIDKVIHNAKAFGGRFYSLFLLVGMCGLSVCLFWACQKPRVKPLFTQIPAQKTGINFENTLVESVAFNILNYLYFFNGAGVAIGDINGDDLPDIYFTANQGANKLYLNQGDFKFADITEKAGVAGVQDWTTGVSMADINGDGLLDIYVCQLSGYEGRSGANQLFINQGDLQFKEAAEAYGLAFQGFSTQSAFFDYDRDGDLDMYLLNHSVHANNTYQDTAIRREMHPRAGDRLFRNDGDTFTDVTEEAGIISSAVGYGLGISISDLNQDGWLDIYIGNDFHENDYLYLNQQDGSFQEVLPSRMGHTSRFTMGVDIADINNDAWPDVFSLDMKPEREDILKTSEGAESFNIYKFKLSYGYHHQYTHNALQLSQQGRYFSEISQLAGVDATDWSWSALFADFDLDGWKDLYITNGIYRRPNDMDYINFISEPEVVRSLNAGITQQNISFIEKMPQVEVANYAYRNNTNLQFSPVSKAWGLDQRGFSNGAAYADLDRDGDLDLVVNNINQPAFVYQNQARAQHPERQFISLILKAKKANTHGVGAKVWLYTQGEVQYQELISTRGFQSSVEPRLLFGLGSQGKVDSLRIQWPDGTYSLHKGLEASQQVQISQNDSAEKPTPASYDHPALLQAVDFPFEGTHKENTFYDFYRERLMPMMLSNLGPCLAVGDVNRDGLEDLYVGGSRGEKAGLWLQRGDGSFTETSAPIWEASREHEEVDARFFDADGDQDLDLYVVSGGNEGYGKADFLQDLLYLNDGRGNFSLAEEALPPMYENGSCVRPFDFDHDGDLDLFIGGLSVAGHYGLSPQSFLLINDGKGIFSDRTHLLGVPEQRLGMVSDACWVDWEGDGKEDLVVVGYWMPVRVFKNEGETFTEITTSLGLEKSNGWWNSVEVGDWDGDGDKDLLLGNLGLNSPFDASEEEPCHLYLNDFDQNGSLDPILCSYKEGKSYPFATRDELLDQINPLKKKYQRYNQYALQGIEQIFEPEILKKSIRKETYTFASAWLENTESKAQLHALPLEAQFAPVMDFWVGDIDEDQADEVLLVGNQYGVGPNVGRFDASIGALLKWKAGTGFSAVPPENSGFWVQGDAREIVTLRQAQGKQMWLVGRNSQQIQAFGSPAQHP